MKLATRIRRTGVVFWGFACVSLSSASSEWEPPLSKPASDQSAELPASGAIAVLAFPDLTDPARAAPPSADTRRLGSPGRRVPIKLHLPTRGGPFPVIIVSHGAGGTWDTHFAQAQDLAAHGYAVACIEHVGSNLERLRRGLRPIKNLLEMTRDADEVLTRPRDASFVLDRLAEWNNTHPRLKGRFDLSHVGMMGHSFGAYTTMVVCGMRPALDWLSPAVKSGKGLGPDLADPRVDCGVALSPQSPGEPFFLAESYASLRVPLLGITGSKDDQQAGRTAMERKTSFALWPKGEHRLIWLANARHADFSDPSGSTDRALPSPTRSDAQPVIREATRAFFDLYLKANSTAADRLTVRGLRPYLHGDVDAVELLVK
jgi:predicted dienelactone hydrolase